jgi:hypothetical protein
MAASVGGWLNNAKLQASVQSQAQGRIIRDDGNMELPTSSYELFTLSVA